MINLRRSIIIWTLCMCWVACA